MKTLFHEIEKAGAKFHLLDGALKLSALPGTISPDLLARIRKRKAEIITLFTAQQKETVRVEQDQAPILEGLPTCPLCGDVLFNEDSEDAYFCINCQTLSENEDVARVVCETTSRKVKKVDYEPDLSRVLQENKRRKPSPIALAWLLEHRQAMKAAGWTMPELYRRNMPKGIVWCEIWDKEALEITIKDDGVVTFQYFNNIGQKITQTARPMPQRIKQPRI